LIVAKKLARQHIRRDRVDVIRVGRLPESLLLPPDNALLAHEALDALLADTPSLPTKRAQHPFGIEGAAYLARRGRLDACCVDAATRDLPGRSTPEREEFS
jgi:hypothetical protein